MDYVRARAFRAQTACLLQAGINSPFRTKFSNILAGGFAVLAQIHGRVKTDPAAADDRHSLTNRRFIAQYLRVGQYF